MLDAAHREGAYTRRARGHVLCANYSIHSIIPPPLHTHRRRCVPIMTARTVLAATLWAASAAAAQGDSTRALRLPRLFGDGMVLQRDARVPVWGWSAPGRRGHRVDRRRAAHRDGERDGRVAGDAAPADRRAGRTEWSCGPERTASCSATSSWATCGSRRGSRTWSSRSAGARNGAAEIAAANDRASGTSRCRPRSRARRRKTLPAARGPRPTRSTSDRSAPSRTSSRAICARRWTCRSASSTRRGAGAASRRG